ncbi:TlpA family protein disulfide reductase [Sphingobacterium lumbrici]|uniref:TlpA family protein disulfide reductase n=1 Tax=Sphingobacterium lumbrici TaxID=2559600 RepID=UPI0011269F7B|nr:TlpA disulfide reductase family protein [Sphingobacterium lumbrici]
MKISQKILIVAFALTLSVHSSFAQKVEFVTIDSTAVYFKNADSIAARKAIALKGLTDFAKATPEFMKALNEAAADKNFKLAEQLYYTAEYIQVPFEQYRKYLFSPSGEWSSETYGDIDYSKKAIVLRKATGEEQQKNIEMSRSYFAPREGTSMAKETKEINNKLMGKAAPDFTCKTMDGKDISLNSLKGKVVVINFWFTQCRPCVEEIPELNAIANKYKGNTDVVFLGIEVRPETTKEEVEKFLKRVPFVYEIAMGGKDAAALYEAKTFPANFVIDKEGVVRMGAVGTSPFIIDELEKIIPTLL